MKKLSFLILASSVLMLASCVKASEKAAGTYGTSDGNFNLFGNYAGTTSIVTAGDNVNVTMTVPSMSITGVANGVTATMSGDNVSLSFSSTSTTDGDITAISGTVTGNSLSTTFTVRVSGSPLSGTFTGTK